MLNGCGGAVREFPPISTAAFELKGTLGALSEARFLTWRFLGMLDGFLVGAGRREFPPVCPVRLIWARSAGPNR